MNNNNQTVGTTNISPVIEEVKKGETITTEQPQSNMHAFELKDLTYTELIECYVNVHDFIKYLKGLKE